jgi:hypothetical protein
MYQPYTIINTLLGMDFAGNDAIVTMAKLPVHQQWQQRHCDKGNNTSLTTAMLPLGQGQQCYCNDGKNIWTAKMPAH